VLFETRYNSQEHAVLGNIQTVLDEVAPDRILQQRVSEEHIQSIIAWLDIVKHKHA